MKNQCCFECKADYSHWSTRHTEEMCYDCQETEYVEMFSDIGIYPTTLLEVINNSFQPVDITIGRRVTQGFHCELTEAGWYDTRNPHIKIHINGEIYDITSPIALLDVFGIDCLQYEDGFTIPNFDWEWEDDIPLSEKEVYSMYNYYIYGGSINEALLKYSFGDRSCVRNKDILPAKHKDTKPERDDYSDSVVDNSDYELYIAAEKRKIKEEIKEEHMKQIEFLQRCFKQEINHDICDFGTKLIHLKGLMPGPFAKCYLCEHFGTGHVSRKHARYHGGPLRSTFILTLQYMLENGDWELYEDALSNGAFPM